MPKLGLSLGLPTNNSIGGLDPDALAFIATAGVTDATAKDQINSFVKGVKDLGIWSSFVCWPLINTQQGKAAGTTSGTIYSLGGLGTFNGTMTSSPTIGTNGVTCTGTNQSYIVLPSGAALLAVNPVTSGAVYKSSGTVWASAIHWLYGNWYGATTNQNSGGWFREGAGSGAGLLNQMRGSTNLSIFGTDAEQTTFAFLTNTTSGSASNNSINYKNGTAVSTNTVGTTVSPAPSGATSYRICFAQNSATFSGTMTFHFVARDVLFTSGQVSSFYTLYKNTLGSSVGLP